MTDNSVDSFVEVTPELHTMCDSFFNSVVNNSARQGKRIGVVRQSKCTTEEGADELTLATLVLEREFEKVDPMPCKLEHVLQHLPTDGGGISMSPVIAFAFLEGLRRQHDFAKVEMVPINNQDITEEELWFVNE